MRKRDFLFIICFLLPWPGLHAQAWLGTKTPYVPLQSQYTPAPAGYTPMYVDYVGRHGARYLTKAGADVQVWQTLQAAARSNGLTAAGMRIMAVAERLAAAGKGNYENITLLGAEEQTAIAGRMLHQDSAAFRGRGLTVVTTWKVRTQQSAAAFLKAFAQYGGKTKYERAVDSEDVALRFYDLSPAYLRYKKSALLKKALDSLDKDARTAKVAAEVGARVFRPGYLQKGLVKLPAFADDLYDLYCIAFSMQGELRKKGDGHGVRDLGAVFTEDELRWFDFRNGAADFLEKGPGFDVSGIQVAIAAPLLVDLIRSGDRLVSGNGGDAVLRFTHAEAISPLAALMGIAGASTPVSGVYAYHDQWRVERVIPLSANIQWIFYGNGQSMLVKVLLNEKEVKLPVAPVADIYYRWEDVRAYYVNKLKGMGVGLEDNMLRFLKEVK